MKKYISEIKDFQKNGVFSNIYPIYKEPKLWKKLMFPLENLIFNFKPDFIAGIESRGFETASALAYKNQILFQLERVVNYQIKLFKLIIN